MRRFLTGFLILGLLCGCGRIEPDTQLLAEIDTTFRRAEAQALYLAQQMSRRQGLPRSFEENRLVTCPSSWWTSGFFPGTLWQLYEQSENPELKKWAEFYTERVRGEADNRSTHDLGFMIFCSFGQGYRLTQNPDYRDVIFTACESLSSRFAPKVGAIRSWDREPWNTHWDYIVIIDNMMNLEMLEWGYKNIGVMTYDHIARTHSNTTLRNHFRPDGGSYHVVSYNEKSGMPEKKQTAQGYSDESTWARGEAWALYGYTMMYRETKDSSYLNMARLIARYILAHLPEDKIPFWDYDVERTSNTLRDASAAAVTCSALIELSGYVDRKEGMRYLKVAESQLRRLISSDYFVASTGENGGFLLKHSVGSIPGNTEVDVPLSYADYYFVEAMSRYRNL